MAEQLTNCTLHLLSLHPSTSVPTFLNLCSSASSSFHPLFAGRFQNWVLRPCLIGKSQLTTHRWDLMLLLREGSDAASGRKIVFPPTGSLDALVNAHLKLHVKAYIEPLERHPAHPPPDLPREWGEEARRPPMEAVDQDERAPKGMLRLTQIVSDWLRDVSALRQGKGPVCIVSLAAYTDGGDASLQRLRSTKAAVGSGGDDGRARCDRVDGVVFQGSLDTSEDRVFGGAGLGTEDNPLEAGAGAGDWKAFDVEEWASVWHWAKRISERGFKEAEMKVVGEGLRDRAVFCVKEVKHGS